MPGAVPSPLRGILPSAESSPMRGTLPSAESGPMRGALPGAEPSTMTRRPTEPPSPLPIRAPITRTSPRHTRVRTPRSPRPNGPRNHLGEQRPPTLRTGLLAALRRGELAALPALR